MYLLKPNGSGYGYGDGYGYDDGNGYGHGRGYGYGNGDGYGNGNGNGGTDPLTPEHVICLMALRYKLTTVRQTNHNQGATP